MRTHFTGKRRLAVAAVTATALALAGAATVRAVSGSETSSLCAYFDDSFGLYPGSPVTIRGVTVGTVRGIEPDGARVRVDMRTDRRELPAETGAVIANASILTDRRVELVDADPGAGPKLPSDTCIDQSRTRTPVSVSDALGSFSTLVRQITELGPDGTAPLEAVLRDAGGQVEGLGPTLNRELRDLADLLATPDSFMAQLGDLLDNSAAMSEFVSRDWEDVKITLQTFGPGLGSIAEMLVVVKDLVERLSAAVGPLDRLFHDHFPYLMNTLNSTLPILTMVRTRAENSGELLAKIPGVVGMLQTMVGSHEGSLGVELEPARAEVATPDAGLVCAALAQVAPDSCTVLSERSVSVPLPQLVLSTIGATP
ncbi:MCE family protein [Nocardia higoensis]|uniref:MCE family protein n=1 Tax=Nocardia higoensis TaxID=228599 RepID=UPI0002E2158B|nr:MCE family protein [Nocardia higoensis]